ncbi:MAG: hypothetical protein KF779_00240 [Hyphomonadaceae bacterium]|nr:hypothetical protein [Hyphomonadaceae bacterium]MCA8885659.1 hypothetical protein [Hyphomonadaceae bacterium]
MSKTSAALIAGVAMLATAGVAQAQERVAAPVPAAEANQGAVPWYQRFTASNGVTESILGDQNGLTDQLAPAWTLSQRWGVTVDVREAQRIERAPDGGHGNQTSVGAYYRFTPNLSVGGQVNLETTPAPGAAPVRRDNEEPRADVRIESAFRF